MERRTSNKTADITRSDPRAWNSRAVCSCRLLRTHSTAHSLFVSSVDHRVGRLDRRLAPAYPLHPVPLRLWERKQEIACIRWLERFAQHLGPRLCQYDLARTT